VASALTDQQWRQYEEQGYLHLGQVASDQQLAALQQRMDDIMLGKADVNYDQMMFQLDSATGAYGDAGAQTKGHKGATLDYRKIEGLEFDRVFLEYMQHPLYRDICERVYGKSMQVRSFRAMFMNKPARRGTILPWHQDRWNFLDRDPLVTIWMALDPATIANGCVQIIPGSHKKLVNPEHGSGFLTKEQADALDVSKAIFMELKPGEVVLLHNWTLHRSDVNKTDIPRRGFSVCYMDGRTELVKEGGEKKWPVLFGEDALDPNNLSLART